MNSGNGNDVCAVFLVEVVKIGCVLEVVCVTFAAFNDVVRNDVIRENLYVKRDVLLGKNLLYFFKNFCMRSG